MTTPQILDAVHELSQAKARYCLAVDAKDWDAFSELMTADIRLDVSDGNAGVPVIVGRDSAVAMIRASLTGAKTCHQVHTPLIDVDGDVARVVWAMQDRILWDNGATLTGYGHYHERWIREHGAWKLASLTLTRLITELSRPTDRPET
ncbi:nuclear transport factor 2 family protein [Nocardia abscessus]|uniref:nuclear transport factor 2 family protein n=1 Tax=Nocardia abscessus TaxID=120957 RepID=UPI0002DB2B98|nr:nuclear transport factor 2 family protein [Nocardia abscessus]MCC3331497.1 nuclear transport factor 2 family protein [Nocardia abscessus]